MDISRYSGYLIQGERLGGDVDSETLQLLILIGVWIVMQSFVLPRLGIST